MFQKKEKILANKIELLELRKIQIELLDAFAHFCETNNLRYYLCGGTLLGAIRHKGYIPWDDDIDINMPRPDCQKLIEISNGQIEGFRLSYPPVDKERCCAFMRLYNMDTIICNKMEEVGIEEWIPIFIDIFPIEGLPNSQFFTKLHYKFLHVLRFCASTCFHRFGIGKTTFHKIIHIIMKPLLMLVGKQNWQKLMLKSLKYYDYNCSKYVGVATTYCHNECEKIKKEEYEPDMLVEFEGREYRASKGYHTYLSQLYGEDYMQLPPKDKRKTNHDFTAYWLKN